MNPQQLLAALAALQTPQAMAPVATEKPQVNGVQITGAIVQFENSEPKIGDVNLRSVPENVEWTIAKTRDGKEYLRSKNEFSAIAHIGEHGRVWGDGVVDTGAVSSVFGANASFKDRLAAIKGTRPVEASPDDDTL